MKKVIALLLALSMCFALCGCSKSKEAMLDEAITVSCVELFEQYRSNAASAIDSYEGKYINVEIHIGKIEKDVVLATDADPELRNLSDTAVYVHFKDNDILKTLNSDCDYEIVGEIHFRDVESYNANVLEITNAYII